MSFFTHFTEAFSDSGKPLVCLLTKLTLSTHIYIRLVMEDNAVNQQILSQEI